MKQFLVQFDNFGVPLNLKIQSKQSLYKSALGGFFSLSIYTISLLYFIYIFYAWYSDQIPPKMFTSNSISTFKHLNLDYDVINVGFLKPGLDPFLQENNILTPLLFIGHRNGTIKYQSLLDNALIENPGMNQRTIQIKGGINKFSQDGFTDDDTVKIVLLVKCNKTYLTANQSCASDGKIAEFFAQPNNNLQITLNSILLDSSNEPITNPQQYTFYFEEQFTYYLNLDLKTNIYAINKNLFTSQYKIIEYISGSQNYGQTTSVNFSLNMFDEMLPYGVIYIKLQTQQTQITIQYSQIGELLAQIGSIVSVLFLIKHIMYEINRRFLERKILDEVIHFYYPEFEQVKLEYNLFNTLKSAQFKNYQLNLPKFIAFYQKLLAKAECKLSLNNLIYEQSRMFMILRSIKNEFEFKQSHQIGINLNLLLQGSESTNINDCQFSPTVGRTQLNDNDFDLISLINRNNERDDEGININRLTDQQELNNMGKIQNSIVSMEPPISSERVMK